MARVIPWAALAKYWFLFFSFSLYMWGQDDAELRPAPILNGSTAYFTRVTAGTVQDAPSVSPILLAPLGDKFLVEAKENLSDTFAKNSSGAYSGLVSYGAAYAQIDYIANPYVTVSGGRFTTPFGLSAERFAPNCFLMPLPRVSAL